MPAASAYSTCTGHGAKKEPRALTDPRDPGPRAGRASGRHGHGGAVGACRARHSAGTNCAYKP
eukprot:127917-Hanusia_phi.AAC.1